VVAEVDLALRRERAGDEYRATLQLVLQNAHQLARIVETLVAAAQHKASGRGADAGLRPAATSPLTAPVPPGEAVVCVR
jgi:hypothetical protein